MADDEELKPLFADVRAALQEENYAGAIAGAQKVLSKAPGDADAVRVKVIASLYLNKYEEALAAAKGHEEALSFERGYALYRLGRCGEAIKALGGSDAPEALHLKAQALFKDNRHSEAADVYAQLFQAQHDEDDSELPSNLYAAAVAAGRGPEILERFPVDEALMDHCYELGLNTGAAMADHGDLHAAEDRLKEAEAICQRLGEEDGLSAEKILNESCIIQLELANVLLRRGRREEAVERLATLAKAKLDDAVARLVALNNNAALKGDKELRGLLKKLKATAAEAEPRMLPSQKAAWTLNQALIALKTGKPQDAGAMVEALKAEGQGGWALGLLEVSFKLKAHEHYCPMDDLKKLLSSLGPKDEEGRRHVGVALAQALVDQGKLKEAADVLEGISSLKGYPAVAATLAGLYQRLGDSESALKAFDTAIEAARDKEARVRLLQGAAALRMRDGQYQGAAEAYREVLESEELETEERLRITAQLVVATSWFDPEAAEPLAESLPLSGLYDEAGELVAEDLETQGLPRTQHRSRLSVDLATARERRRKVDPEKRKRRRDKLRLKYIEKLKAEGKYDPKRQPDPERWIPKSQRSYNKRGRKGRGKFVGAQGSGDGAQKDAARLDVAARVKKAAEEGAGGGGGGAVPPPGVGRRKRR